MAGITEGEAHRLLEGSSKLFHSVLVARIMEVLAPGFAAAPQDWGLVGLLHDLDQDATEDEPSLHGLRTVEMLAGRLPDASLRAIKCHDHRSGIKPVTVLDRALIFADNLAILIENQKLKTPCTPTVLFEAVRRECQDKPWIAEYVLGFAEREGLAIWDVVNKIGPR
ncbi:MAG: HD domain-containing protein [Candidatus Bathyarchaeota archaeon]|nr:HD domain-containing protein [Candidatus Bathyarchaeota archaeon]